MPLRKVRTEDAERSGGRLVSEAVQRRPIESGPGKVVRFPASQCLLAAENEPVQEDPRSAKLASEDYSGPSGRSVAGESSSMGIGISSPRNLRQNCDVFPVCRPRESELRSVVLGALQDQIRTGGDGTGFVPVV